MNKKEIETLLYTQEAIDFGNYLVDAWFDDQTAEKHIDVVVKKTRKEGGFIANGMTCEQLKNKIFEVLNSISG